MKAWHKRYYQGIANEQAALKQAKEIDLGVDYIGTDGETYIAWPNGETSPRAEYDQWLAHQALRAQYGDHG